MEVPMDWDLQPGDTIRRVELHRRYGGGGQGGISPSTKTPNVFIFSDPARGTAHGYLDDWRDDGPFHYTGEGQRGDQQMRAGNKAILQHREDDRALRVFQGVGGDVIYQGRFELATDPAWYSTDAPESGRPDVVRKVVVFRLRPVDATPHRPSSALDRLPSQRVAEVPVEEQNTERVYVQPNHEPYEAERREQQLVLAYCQFLREKGSYVTRHLIRPEGEAKPMFSDVYDVTRNNLIEAKGTVTREAIRMAIGQLADYRRFIEPRPSCAVLLPERPRPDLEALLSAEGLAVVWSVEGGTFADNRAGSFI
jgi:hypothetical protein